MLATLTLWMLIAKDLASSASELGYSVEQYHESPGIYFENRGQASLYNTHWKTVVYVNLEQTTDQSAAVEQYIKHINTLCQEVEIKNWTECNYFYDIARGKLYQVQRTEKLLLDITEHKHSKRRARRGAFNFIGEVSKILFGTMNDEDAQYYNEQIRHFEENSESMTHLMKQQLTVVKSSLGAINETLSDLEYNEAKVKEGLMQVKAYVESVVSAGTRVTNTLLAKITVESHIARVTEALNKSQRNLDILIDSIVNARKGILQPQVVPPSLLIDALIHSAPVLP